MDDTTRAVRELYEAFPYPSGPPIMRAGFDARFLLSLGRLARSESKPIQVLDAGCSRGVGTLGAATLQPDVQFTGIDLNRVGLAEARSEAERRGLNNVNFAEVDLMTLDGLTVPAGGFDVIISSGVVHHLSDPAKGMAGLSRVLAPHGILSLMVYARRDTIHPIAKAIALLAPRQASLVERLQLGRELARDMAAQADCPAMWMAANEADNVEFVDRYLHPNEHHYGLIDIWNLARPAGLRPLAFADPREWSIDNAVPEGDLRRQARAMSKWRQALLMESIKRPGNHELYLCKAGNGARAPLTNDELPDGIFAVHPESVIRVDTRSLWCSTRIESIAIVTRSGEELPLPKGPMATAGMILRDQNEPFEGKTLLAALEQEGISPSGSRECLQRLIQIEALYRPHAVDCTQPQSELVTSVAG